MEKVKDQLFRSWRYFRALDLHDIPSRSIRHIRRTTAYGLEIDIMVEATHTLDGYARGKEVDW